jgi:hypothetical protein
VTKGPLNYTTTIDATKSASECIAHQAGYCSNDHPLHVGPPL